MLRQEGETLQATLEKVVTIGPASSQESWETRGVAFVPCVGKAQELLGPSA